MVRDPVLLTPFSVVKLSPYRIKWVCIKSIEDIFALILRLTVNVVLYIEIINEGAWPTLEKVFT